jgi:hypothetical protein
MRLLALEAERRGRLVCANSRFVAVVPFWAVWPLETLVLPRAHVRALDELDGAGREAFAQILKDATMRYDGLFGVSFPYSMGIHQQPTDGLRHPQWHLQRISIRRCCARRRCGSSWWGMKCWRDHSGILRRKQRRPNCVVSGYEQREGRRLGQSREPSTIPNAGAVLVTGGAGYIGSDVMLQLCCAWGGNLALFRG